MTYSDLTILVVDDEHLNTRMLQALLHKAGYEAVCASSGAQGRALAREIQPDLILLDVMMPEESGFDACSYLKKDPHTADIPIIFISALDDVDSRVQGLELGGVDFISKPFQKEEVLARVKTHLQLRHSYRQVIQRQAEKLQQVQQAQQSYLVQPEDEPEARFSVHYTPVLEAGGDFYDVFRITHDTWGYFVADVSGHDLGSSLATSALKVLIRQNSSPVYTPLETMGLINKVLLEFFSAGKYLTACYVSLDRKRREISIVSAGHPALLYQKQGHEPEFMSAHGDVLGAFEGAEFGFLQFKVQPEDRFFLYSDGLLESYQEKKTLSQGQSDLRQAVIDNSNLDIFGVTQTVVHDLLIQGREPEDDALLLGVEV